MEGNRQDGGKVLQPAHLDNKSENYHQGNKKYFKEKRVKFETEKIKPASMNVHL